MRKVFKSGRIYTVVLFYDLFHVFQLLKMTMQQSEPRHSRATDRRTITHELTESMFVDHGNSNFDALGIYLLPVSEIVTPMTFNVMLSGVVETSVGADCRHSAVWSNLQSAPIVVILFDHRHINASAVVDTSARNQALSAEFELWNILRV